MMNASKVFALVLASSLVGPSAGQAGQAIGPAKARGDVRPFSQTQQSADCYVRRTQPAYRYSAPQTAQATVESQVNPDVPDSVVAQAPAAEARRFSQAPAAEKEAASTSDSKPCPQNSATATSSSSGRRYSYAPGSQYSGNSGRSYSRNSGNSSSPTWSLLKTNPAKYDVR